MAERPPDPRLAGVLRYCGYRERSREPFARLEVPSGQCHRDPLVRRLDRGQRLDAQVVRRRRCTRSPRPRFAGAQHGVEVKLTPQAARMLFGVPLNELSSELVVDADHMLGRGTDLLVERLAEAPGWAARFDLLDAELARRLAAAEEPSREVGWAFGRLRATAGGEPVGALATELGWSPRRLIARFRDQIGLPPKAVARILRFERVVGRLGAGDSLADVAYDAGYYDQAHMNRDFREFAQLHADRVGRAPAARRRRHRGLTGGGAIPSKTAPASGVPCRMTTFYPSLRYNDAQAAIDWLQQAFGFEPREVHKDDNGTIVHAEMAFGDAIVMLGTDSPDRWGKRAGDRLALRRRQGPRHRRPLRAAKAAGAEIFMEPISTDYGSRDYSARDLEGNLWSFGTYEPDCTTGDS